MTKSDQVNALFNQIEEEHKNKHKAANVIVNSAGIVTIRSILDLAEKEFDDVVDVNLKGTHLVTQEATKRLVELHKTHTFLDKKESLGSIVNLSSHVVIFLN